MTSINWIKTETIDGPIDAKTSDFFEKLMFTIKDLAPTREFELDINPEENSCQKAIPKNA